MNETKKLIAIIDNESESFKNIEIAMKKLGLLDEFDIEYFSINIEDDVDQCIERLKEKETFLEAIMIDMVLFETKWEREYLNVIPVFKKIRQVFPNIPIFFITKHIELKYLPLITWCSLEDIDGIAYKQYLYNDKEFTKVVELNKDDFKKIIQMARQKRNRYTAVSTLFLPEKEEEENSKWVRDNLHLDEERTFLQIKEIGSTIFRHLIEKLFGEKTCASGRVTVSYFRPGFSGSYLFKVNIYNENGIAEPWLMKVNKANKVEIEFNNSKRIREELRTTYYTQSTERFVIYGDWGAFGSKLQSAALTLYDYLCQNTSININILYNISNALLQLYTKRIYQPMRLWKEHYKFSPKLYDRLLSFFNDIEANDTLYKGILTKSDFKELDSFVRTRGGTIKNIYEKEYKVNMGIIHGDLNARNVLINSKNHQIILIDFANMEEKGHLTRDIAKLEADLIFSVLHGNSRKFFDWHSISKWENLLSLININDIFNCNLKITVKDREVQKIGNLIITMRKILKEHLYREVDPSEYLISLLYYSLHYLIYPDISIQKKIFGIKWIFYIISQLY